VHSRCALHRAIDGGCSESAQNMLRSADHKGMPQAILKPLDQVALLLMTRPARTERGREVQAAVLARVEIALAIQAELKGL
jgi:hypothetical protein